MQIPQAGDLFDGRYRVAEVLGSGGFATVFRALDGSSRAVALKILTPEQGQYGADVRARFDRELRMLGQLRDPHTVRLFDFGEAANGLLFMVFELVPGRDLSEVLAEVGRLPAPTVVHILRQVLASLREAHAIGILHRDLKPENIRIYEYVGDPWNVKLLDFGIARTLGAAYEPPITRAGELIGTPRYMSPEQLMERPLTPSSDLYSLGLVMHELLGGREVLAGHGWSDQLDRLRSGHLFSLPALDRVGPGLTAIMEKMCARDPGHRFQSVEQVLHALDELDAPSPAPRGTIEADPPASPAPSLGPYLIALGIVLLAVVIAVGYVFERAPESPVPRVRVTRARPPTNPAKQIAPVRPEPDAGPSAADMVPINISGCGKSAPFEGLGELGRTEGISQSSWATYIPRSYDPDRAHPLVFLFHDEMQSPEELLLESGFEALADEQGLVLIAPWGGKSASWDVSFDVEEVRRRRDVAGETLCIDETKIYVVGHGAGGIAAERLSCASWVAALVTTSYRSNNAAFSCRPAQQVPHLQFNATESTRMPADGGRACGLAQKLSLRAAEDRWAERNGCPGDPVEVETTNAGTCYRWEGCEAQLEACRVKGGHGWPGRTGPREEFDLLNCDPPPGTFPATRVIGGFFDRLDE